MTRLTLQVVCDVFSNLILFIYFSFFFYQSIINNIVLVSGV